MKFERPKMPAILDGMKFKSPSFRSLALVLLSVFCLSTPYLHAATQEKKPDDLVKIKADQESLAAKYAQLEAKLLSLAEYEKSNNPGRAKLLERAFVQSQEKMTVTQLNLVVKLMQQSKFKDAEGEQKLALAQMTELLNLLQSEDRSKQVRDDIKRYQAYAKEVDRILRIQKGIRGQTEGGVDEKRVEKAEAKTAGRTGDLADQIKKDNDAAAGKSGDPQSGDPQSSGGKPGKPSDGKPNDQDKPKDDGDGKPSDSQPKNDDPENEATDDKKPSDGDSSSDPSDAKPSDSEPSDGKPSDSEPSDGKPSDSKPTPGQSGESGSGGDSQSPPQQDQPPQDPIQQKIKAAQKRMDKAREALKKAKRKDAVEQMREAEKELAAAKKELEEILRQLREEEVEQTLAMLEERFRKMLEEEVRVYEASKKLSKTSENQRGTEFQVNAGKLAVKQNSIAADAARALLLLKEDGSSVAFPVTVEELQNDMLQVAGRLSDAKVNQITIEIEEDIIETLKYLIEALVQTQKDMEEQKDSQQQQQQQQGKPGEAPLVDQLAEIKMLRGLQQRIHRRHQRYSKFLEDPNDPVGASTDPDVTAALKRLAARQAQLTEITRELVNETKK